MRCDDIQASLADFLSGELASADATEIRQHLQHCAACANEIRGLREAVDGFQAGAISGQTASQRAANIELHFAERLSDSRAIRAPMAALLRYAAVIAISFCSGYWLRPAATGTAAEQPVTSDRELVLVRRYDAASRAYPKAAGMSKGLLALANAERSGP